MNRDFISNFEKPEIKPETAQDETDESPDSGELDRSLYTEGDYIRNLCFVWPEQKRHFISYHRLDSGLIDGEHTAIRLFFGNDVVDIVGLKLFTMFEYIMAHKQKFIYCEDDRYNYLADNDEVVNEITITRSS